MRLRKLGMALSKLDVKENMVASLEQYVTPGDLASRWLFDIQAFGALSSGCRVADLGAGNGILGIGAVMMGAGFVKLVEADQKLCELAKANAESVLMNGKYEVCNRIIGKDSLQLEGYDLIISNPPWGRQKEGADSDFIEYILASKTQVNCFFKAYILFVYFFLPSYSFVFFRLFVKIQLWCPTKIFSTNSIKYDRKICFKT